MPAQSGAAALVPPRVNQPEPRTGLLSKTQTPVLGFASADTSGTCLCVDAGKGDWYAGRGSNLLTPPPPSSQAASKKKLPRFGPLFTRPRVVPPTATTLGETLGHTVPAESPLEAK